MAEKYVYSAQYSNLADAAAEFPEPKDLWMALEERAVVAEGRYEPDATDDDPTKAREGDHNIKHLTNDCQSACLWR